MACLGRRLSVARKRYAEFASAFMPKVLAISDLIQLDSVFQGSYWLTETAIL